MWPNWLASAKLSIAAAIVIIDTHDSHAYNSQQGKYYQQYHLLQLCSRTPVMMTLDELCLTHHNDGAEKAEKV